MNLKKKNNIHYKYIFILFSLITLISCSTVQIGQDFKLDTFTSNAVPGKTTKGQVLKWLGSPMSKGISHKENGEQLDEWSYFYSTGELPSMKDTKLKILQIRFDKQDTLRSYNWSGTNKRL